MPPVINSSSRKTGSGGAKVLHEDMQQMQEELENQSILLEEINKHLKKLERSSRMTSLASWARILLLYLPILVLLLFSIFVLPKKFKEYIAPYTAVLGIGDSAAEQKESNVDKYKAMLQDLSPKQLGEIKGVIDSIR